MSPDLLFVSRSRRDVYLEVIHDINNGIVINNNELIEISEILNHLELLKRKYGGSMASVADYYSHIQAQEKETDSNNEEIQCLDSERIVLQTQLNKKAKWISEKHNKHFFEKVCVFTPKSDHSSTTLGALLHRPCAR